MTRKATTTLLLGVLLLPLAHTAFAAPRFDPDTECTSADRGPYPWNFRKIVTDHIGKTFFDPNSVTGLEAFKPAPGWWTTASFKMTRRNTQCYWFIGYKANGKNRMGGYVGQKAFGLWVKNGIAVHSAERTSIDKVVLESGNRAFSDELDKLSAEDREEALRKVAEEPEAQRSGPPSYLQELRELAQLRDEGIITDEEFEQKKKEILGLEKTTEEDGAPK